MIGVAGGVARGVGRSGPVGPRGGDGTLRGMTGRVRGRWLRAFAAAGAAGAVAAGTAACEPTGYSNTSAIAVTTDRQGTRALEWESVQVRWLSCTASAPNGGEPAPRGTAGATPVTTGGQARVNCQGQSVSGERITITGYVTREVYGRCVEGSDLVARVGDRVVFRTNTIGNCNAPTAGGTASPNAGSSSRPARDDNSGGGGQDDNSGGGGQNNNSGGGGGSDDSGGGSDNGDDNGNGNGGGGGQNSDDHHDDGWNGDEHGDDCPDGDHHGDQGDDDQDNGHDDGKWHEDDRWQNGKEGKEDKESKDGKDGKDGKDTEDDQDDQGDQGDGAKARADVRAARW